MRKQIFVILLFLMPLITGCMQTKDPYADWYWLTIARISRYENEQNYLIIKPAEINGEVRELIKLSDSNGGFLREGDQAWFECRGATTNGWIICQLKSFDKYAIYEKSLQKKEDIENSSNSGTEDTRGYPGMQEN